MAASLNQSQMGMAKDDIASSVEKGEDSLYDQQQTHQQRRNDKDKEDTGEEEEDKETIDQKEAKDVVEEGKEDIDDKKDVDEQNKEHQKVYFTDQEVEKDPKWHVGLMQQYERQCVEEYMMKPRHGIEDAEEILYVKEIVRLGMEKVALSKSLEAKNIQIKELVKELEVEKENKEEIEKLQGIVQCQRSLIESLRKQIDYLINKEDKRESLLERNDFEMDGRH